MVVQIVGNRVVGGATYTPPPEPTNNPNVFSKIKEPTARNWDSLGRPTNLPDFTQRAPLSVSDRLAGRSSPQLTPPGSGTTVVPASRNYVPLSSRLAGGSTPSIIPGGIPTATTAQPSPIPRGAGIRVPSGAGGIALGVISSLPTELPRLMSLLNDPQQYWREQEQERRREMPWLYPGTNTARTGFGQTRSPLATIPFSGGQSAGVAYQIAYQYEITTQGHLPSPTWTPASGTITLTGPIQGISVRSNYQATPQSAFATNIIFLSAGVTIVAGGGSGPENWVKIRNAQIISANRQDGQPDTGGDPAPVADPSAPRRPALAPNTAPFFPAAPSRTPNAVPFNAPHLINPQTGARIAPNTGTDTASRPAGAPATVPNPFGPASTIAPTITPEQLKRVTPSALIPATAPASPNGLTSYSDPFNEVRRQGQDLGNGYEESYSDYQRRLLGGSGSGETGTTPGLLPMVAAGGLLLGGLAYSNWPQPRTSTIPLGGGTTTGIAGDPDITPAPGGSSSNTPGFCRFAPDPYTRQINSRTGRIEVLDTAIQAYQTTEIAKMQNKLGAQIPNGGIGGKLGRMAGLASKTWNFLQIDRALAVFTWIGVLHNAYMLSNNLGQTLFSAISNGLDAIGIQKVDDDGNEEPYDVGEIVSKYTDNFAKSVFGTSTWEGIKADWKKLNRIYQAATNLLNSLQSMTYAMLEGLETVGNYTAKIGNAARIFGVFTEKAFNPMKDNLNFKGGRFFRFLERTEEFVENIDSIASSVVDIQQTAADCADQKAELTTAIQAFETTKTAEETTKKTNSTSPPITPADQQKPES